MLFFYRLYNCIDIYKKKKKNSALHNDYNSNHFTIDDDTFILLGVKKFVNMDNFMHNLSQFLLMDMNKILFHSKWNKFAINLKVLGVRRYLFDRIF